jgi:hypothetical protein
VRVLAVASVVALYAGCSWLFDPAGLPVLDAATPPDLGAAVDLSPVDFAPAPPDCTTMPVFPSFADGGAQSPYDCHACGCIIDDFQSTAELPRKWTLQAAAGWSITAANGTLTQQTASGVTNDVDAIYSTSHFYVDGDFDALVDTQVGTWWGETYVSFGALGAINDAGVYAPFGEVSLHNNAGTSVDLVINLDRTLVTLPSLPSPSLEITRTGGKLCVGMEGALSACRDGGREPLALQVWTVLTNGGCPAGCACCPVKVGYSNLRLRSGRLVSAR